MSSKQLLDFFFCLSFDLGIDAVGDHFEGGEEGGKVVGEAGYGDEVGDEVDGEDEVAEGADDDAFEPDWHIAGGQHIVEQQGVVGHLAAGFAR